MDSLYGRFGYDDEEYESLHHPTFPSYSTGGFDYSGYYKSQKKTYKSSLGWGSGRLSSATAHTTSYFGKYSTNRVSESDEKEAEILLRQAYKAVRDIVVILDFPKNVEIHLKSRDCPRHNGNLRIFIPTKILDKKEVEDMDKINILCGLGAHESAHLMYTEYRTYDGFFKKSTTKTISEEYLLHAVIDMLEDERVEDLLLTSRPGYSEIVDASKSYTSDDLKNYKAWKDNTELNNFMRTLYGVIRFPELVDSDTFTKYYKIFGRIQKFTTPQSTKEACIFGKNIVDIVLEEFKDLPDYSDDAFGNLMLDGLSSMLSEVMYGFDTDSGKCPDPDQVSDTVQGSFVLEDILSGEVEKGYDKSVLIRSLEGDQMLYNCIVKRIKAYIPAMQKLVKATDKNYDYAIPGCRSGILDTNKLAEAYQGVPQVYIRNGQVRTSKATVCVIIDESGSMSGHRMYMARDMAVLLNESFGNLPGVDLFIYGHSADETYYGSTDLHIYREGKKKGFKYSLSDCEARRNNRDGVAILDIAKRVKSKMTTDGATMFVISDGAPYASGYDNYDAIRDTKNKVLEAEKLGMEVIHVGIAECGHSSEMFKNRIDLQADISELPTKLGGIIKKAILGTKKTTTI